MGISTVAFADFRPVRIVHALLGNGISPLWGASGVAGLRRFGKDDPMVSLNLFLIIAALILSGLAVFRSQGKSELAWACVCLALALLLPLR